MSPASTALSTLNGTPIEFIPLPTPWPSGVDCESYKYRQVDGHLLAWDPIYGQSFDTRATSCLPSQVTSWWLQTAGPTRTELGPTFACPEAYSAVQTSLVARDIQQVFCCPSGYKLLAPQPNTASSFPSQCISTVTPGATVAFLNLFQDSNEALSASETTSTVQSSTATVFGIPVNGFNFAEHTSTTTLSSTSQPTLSSTSSTTSSASPSASPASSSGPSVATSVGASVGSVLFVLLLCFCGYLLWKRMRRKKMQVRNAPHSPAAQVLWQPGGTKAELHDTSVRVELADRDEEGVYELPAHYK